MLGISYGEHKTNDYVWQQISILVGPQELLLSTVRRRVEGVAITAETSVGVPQRRLGITGFD